jgi:hypothetical protein
VGRPCPGCAKKNVKPRPKKKPWEQSKSADGLNLSDDDFDYEDFIAREFGNATHRKTGLKWYWWALALAILVGMIVGLIRF